MGKQKRQRQIPHKASPVGLSTIKDLEKETEDVIESTDQALQRVLEQLQSVNMEDKLCGLQTLEAMSRDSSTAVTASKDGITKILGPLLIDHSELVRAGAASALRCLADNGGEEALNNLVKDDVVTPIAHLLRKYYTSWQPYIDTKQKNRQDYAKETFIQAVTLLWTLAEKSDDIIKRSEEENLLSLLIPYLNTSIYDLETSIIAIQCILTLSEDNMKALEELKQCEDALLKLLELEARQTLNTAQVYLLRTLVASLLINLNNASSDEVKAKLIVTKSLTVLSKTLNVNCHKTMTDLSTILEKEVQLTHDTKKKIKDLKVFFGAQQQALETLANLCTDDVDSDSESELEDFDNCEYDSEGPEDDPMNDKSFKTDSNIPVEIIEVITSEEILTKVWNKTINVEQSIYKVFETDLEDVLKCCHTLRCRAFLCLNNLISSLDIDTLGGADNLFRLWADIGKVVFNDVDPNDIEWLESATAAMRAALQKLAEIRANMFQQLTMSDLQPMLNGERQCSNANVRANLIRILGNLAVILVNTETVEKGELVKNVSEFLLDTCTKEPEVWVISEALDAIMDVYAEDETDQLALEINLVGKLQSLVPVMQNKIRQQKKKLGDNASIVSTVKTNLTRFIRYKGKRLAKFTT